MDTGASGTIARVRMAEIVLNAWIMRVDKIRFVHALTGGRVNIVKVRFFV